MKKNVTKKMKKLVLPAKKILVKKTPVAKKIKNLIKEADDLCFVHDTDILADDPCFIPQYKSEEAVCADLVANLTPSYDPTLPPSAQLPTPEHVVIRHRAVVNVDCGFSIALPKGYKAQVVLRSGLAKQGLVVCNAPGQIDTDYRGRIVVILCNVGHTNPVVIKHKERFAQIYIEPVHKFRFNPKTELSVTDRGTGGFGSTGKGV